MTWDQVTTALPTIYMLAADMLTLGARVLTGWGPPKVWEVRTEEEGYVDHRSRDWGQEDEGTGGGGYWLFEGRYPKQNYRPPVLCYHSPLSLSLLVYSPLFLKHQRKAYCYYCYYCGLPPVDIIFSCPDTITLITLAKTLIIANPGCFPWTSQANN